MSRYAFFLRQEVLMEKGTDVLGILYLLTKFMTGDIPSKGMDVAVCAKITAILTVQLQSCRILFIEVC